MAEGDHHLRKALNPHPQKLNERLRLRSWQWFPHEQGDGGCSDEGTDSSCPRSCETQLGLKAHTEHRPGIIEEHRNENALGEVRICRNLHFDKYVSPISLEINKDSVQTQHASVCQIWWRYVNTFVSYAWSSIRTDRRTDRWTDRQTDRQRDRDRQRQKGIQTDKPSDEHTYQNANFGK